MSCCYPAYRNTKTVYIQVWCDCRVSICTLSLTNNLQDKHCKAGGANVSLPCAFTREKTPTNPRKNLFRPRSVVIDDNPTGGGPHGFLAQQHTDAKTFMEDHIQVKISPFPSCQQIARKDYLWQHYKAMQDKHGPKHFSFLSESFTLPAERKELIERMTTEKGSLWIVKPPGKNNGAGIHLINTVENIPECEEDVVVQALKLHRVFTSVVSL